MVDFAPLFRKETSFVTSVIFSACKAPSEKGSMLKRKNLLPKFFLFRTDLFSEGRQNNCN